MVEISVVLPVYNEEHNLIELLTSLQRTLSNCINSFEIIVVDGGSRDNSVNISKDLGAKLIVQEDKGFGNAIKKGLEVAQGKYIITIDADNSHHPDFIRKIIESKEDSDLVIGSRFIKDSIFVTNFWRKGLSLILNKISKSILSLPINDLSSGFRIYRRHILQDIYLESKDFDVQLELLIKIIVGGWRVKEVPIVYKKRLYGYSKFRPIKCGLAFLITLFKMYRLRNSILSGDYDDRALRSRLLPQRLWHKFKDKITLRYVDNYKFTLDIGCGSGYFIQALPNAIGLDTDIRKLRYLKLIKKIKANLVLGRAEYLPFKDRVFEQIIGSEVVEHISDSEKIFREFYRVLLSAGNLILTTPHYGLFVWPLLEWLYGKILPNAYSDKHINQYDLEKLKKILKINSFRIIAYKFFLKAIIIIACEKIDFDKQD